MNYIIREYNNYFMREIFLMTFLCYTNRQYISTSERAQSIFTKIAVCMYMYTTRVEPVKATGDTFIEYDR